RWAGHAALCLRRWSYDRPCPAHYLCLQRLARPSDRTTLLPPFDLWHRCERRLLHRLPDDCLSDASAAGRRVIMCTVERHSTSPLPFLAGVAAIVMIGCGPSPITSTRIERAIAPTFANLVHLQLSRMGLPAVSALDIAVTASCRKQGPPEVISGSGD